MKLTVFTLLAILLAPISSEALTITRVADYKYTVVDDQVEYSIEADTLSQADPRRMGVGQFRLRRAYWSDQFQNRHSIMACGQCNVLESLSADGVQAAWAGGGHGNDGDHVVGDVTLDGVLVDLPLSTPTTGMVVEFLSATTLYSTNAEPLQGYQARITIDDIGLLHESRSIALVDHYRHIRYESMLSTDVADYFDEWRIYEDQVLVDGGTWTTCGTANVYPSSGDRAELESSSLGIIVAVESLLGTDSGWLIQNRPSCQKKTYHRVESGVQAIVQGDVRESVERVTIGPP